VSAVTSRFAQWTLDVRDVDRMAEFWSQVLGYEIDTGDGVTHLVPPGGEGLTVWLQPGAGPKDGKNRNHPDLRTDDVEAEVARVLALGATRADVGQSDDDPFVVLADPEGNEFCILRKP
jgi:catechol 2,3-dioxygenase-like lactoylglutathione lyase family enzyme